MWVLGGGDKSKRERERERLSGCKCVSDRHRLKRQ
jgi:hypothetical protein